MTSALRPDVYGPVRHDQVPYHCIGSFLFLISRIEICTNWGGQSFIAQDTRDDSISICTVFPFICRPNTKPLLGSQLRYGETKICRNVQRLSEAQQDERYWKMVTTI